MPVNTRISLTVHCPEEDLKYSGVFYIGDKNVFDGNNNTLQNCHTQ
jgi:hypothetical protein